MTSIYNNLWLNFNNNIPRLSFKGKPEVIDIASKNSYDTYSSNPIREIDLYSVSNITTTARRNQKIMNKLEEYNIPLKVNENTLNELKQNHLLNTRILVANIYSNLPANLKKEIDLKSLQEAAMLHDYGKVLIPDEILNKNGELNDNEKQIMQLHSEFGYELLKDKGFSENSLNLVKYHHQLPDGSGYPKVDNIYSYGIDSEILSVADKYNALIENRSYKDPMKREDALAIINKDVESGLISKEVYNALCKAVEHT